MELHDYRANPVRWRTHTTKTAKGNTVQWRAAIAYKVQTGTKSDGTPTYTTKRKTKLYSPDELPTTLDPESNPRKFNAAANRWIEELEAKQEKAIEEEERRATEAAKLAASDLPSGDSTVGEYVTAFVDDLEASQSIERRTASDYRGIAKKISAGFRGVKLCDLTPTRIQKWENRLINKGLAPATVIKYHRLLSEACKHAVNVDILIKNPCQAVKTPKRTPPSPNSLTAEGFARLAATLDAMEPSPVATAAAIALHTGMRQGEVCGLRWRCYDTEARTIQVEESIGVAHGGTYSKAPKTKSSKRTVSVPVQLARVLERRRRSMLHEIEELGLNLKEHEFGALYVVGFIDGRYRDPLRICKEWSVLSNAFGLIGTQGRKITFHDLRHSFATRAIAAGADVKAVAAVLGHANAAITLNVYADADAESKRRASELVARAIAAQGRLEPYSTAVSAEGVPEYCE